MGCDIHLHIEVKINGKWEHYGAPKIDRNYELFSLFGYCGRCTHNVPIVATRGLPIDASNITKLHHSIMGKDAKHESFIFGDEIRKLQDLIFEILGNTLENYLEHGILKTYLFGNGFAPADWQKEYGIEQVRFVFWFDN